ncbi:hypothetical protein [Arthrobacter luteolus]|uniref:hypothetical protein n=1 Tax=Arthrobacter luteolus TaxID=98672 RepID=UPI00082A1D0C|nr:hypothetical protein [Arthrobacter luteolus]
MRSDWVAATVRARAMARRRAGAGTCREAAALTSLEQALELFAATAYASELAGAGDLAGAQQATRRSALWQLRVLAGWLPVSGARMVRAAGAAYELANILVLARRLQETEAAGSGPEHAPARTVQLPEYFELGGLATAWPRLAGAGSTADLAARLRTSPWGDPGDAGSMADTLSVVWLRRLAAAAPQTRSWTTSAAALIAARRILVDRTLSGPPGTPPGNTDRLAILLRPVLGSDWSSAEDADSFRATLPRSAAPALAGVEQPADLWRAEAALRTTVEDDAFVLLRSGLPGPDISVGAMAVLAVDGWRVRAALAAAASGGGSEVLDAVA